MKILEITFETPSQRSGGGIGVIQSIKSLQKCGEVDYIGPKYDKGIFEESNLHVIGYLEYSNKFSNRIKSILDGVTNGYYQSWKQLLNLICWNDYDLVSVEFTRYPFLVKEAKRHSVITIVRMHNVEKDYFHNLFVSTKKFNRLIQELYYSRQEKECISLCDGLLALTEQDKRRVESLYGNKSNKRIIVNPVCIENTEKRKEVKKGGFLITGSLWYGPNADGVLWLLKNVWNKIDESVHLTIAGARPNKEIESACEHYSNVKVIENPDDMTPIFSDAQYYIAPIFSGAGMKVKIAEAMMYGLPIIATSHALSGYKPSEAVINVNSIEEFVDAITHFSSLGNDEYSELADIQENHFYTNYSIDVSAKNYLKLVNEIKQMEEIR